MEVQSPVSAPVCWSSVVKQKAERNQQNSLHQLHSSAADSQQNAVLVGSCKSSKGIGVAVVDANAIIQGDERLSRSADRFVSVSDVINEIRDPTSRHFLTLLPFTVDTMEPSSEALTKVVSFARATGDLHTLSDVDLKLIALTYTLEAQIHGTQHLRDCPPPIQTVNVKRLPEKDLPGWGSNVPNLEEWEALEHEFDCVSNHNSRILPLKDLNLCSNSNIKCSMENVLSLDDKELRIENLEDPDKELHIENLEDVDYGYRNPRKFFPKKREVKLEGKKMVADGIDASRCEFDDNDGDWKPAVSRSTHRRYLRRKARREMNKDLSEFSNPQDMPMSLKNDNLDGDSQCSEFLMDENIEPRTDENFEDVDMSSKSNRAEDISTNFSNMKLEVESVVTFQDADGLTPFRERVESNGTMSTDAADESFHITDKKLQNLGIINEIIENMDTSQLDDLSSEQSWTLRSLSESTVACITGDFAMQNVLLQMGLRLLAPGGTQIHELHRWVLKCHACFKVTTDIGRIFCPKCGNGGTLRKVAVTVNENGVVLAGRRPRISVRGTKFSLPLPQGGRDAVMKNPVLREDQLPQKFLYPKLKKKNKQEDNIFLVDDVFRHQTDNKSHGRPPVRKALAVFSGKRNPNDNHFSRPKC